jgi:hypothetical protein
MEVISPRRHSLPNSPSRFPLQKLIYTVLNIKGRFLAEERLGMTRGNDKEVMTKR